MINFKDFYTISSFYEMEIILRMEPHMLRTLSNTYISQKISNISICQWKEMEK